MNRQDIHTASEEAVRFLEAVERWAARRKADVIAHNERATKSPSDWNKPITMDDTRYDSGTVESGALRRASLDLTRALARMRKP
jgi:phage shock protein A